MTCTAAPWSVQLAPAGMLPSTIKGYAFMTWELCMLCMTCCSKCFLTVQTANESWLAVTHNLAHPWPAGLAVIETKDMT